MLGGSARRRRGARPADSAQRGAVMVEFALLTPLIVLLLAGFIDFGAIYNDQIAVRQGAREGARLVTEAQGDAHDSECAVSGDFTASVRLRSIACMIKDRTGLDPGDLRVGIRVEDGAPYSVGRSLTVCIAQRARSRTGVFRPMLDDAQRVTRARTQMRIVETYGGAPPLVLTSTFENPPYPGQDWAWCTATPTAANN